MNDELDFEDFAASQGVNLSTASAEEKQNVENIWRGATRQKLIDKYSAQNPYRADAVAEAVNAESTFNAMELAGIRAARPTSPGVYVQHEPRRAEDTLVASLLLGNGMMNESQIGKHFGERVTNAAVSSRNRQMTLHGVVRAVLAANGRHVPAGRLSQEDLRYAFSAGPSGPSTYSIPGILSAAANKTMLEAFRTTPTVWRKFCKVTSVPDFKANPQYRLTHADLLSIVPRGGEIKHTSVTETSYDVTADQRAIIIGLDRKDLVNDDLGALRTVPTQLARASAISLEKDVFTLLLANTGTFFGSGNSNVSTGAGSALAAAGLNTAWQKLFEQVDAEGFPTLITPEILLVPPAIFMTGKTLTESSGTNATTTANVPVPDGNPWKGMLEVVSSPFLGVAGGLTNGSDAAWYLTTGSNDFSVMNVAFLNGREVPMIESEEFSINQLGMAFRAVYDYGYAFHEPRGGIRSAGS